MIGRLCEKDSNSALTLPTCAHVGATAPPPHPPADPAKKLPAEFRHRLPKSVDKRFKIVEMQFMSILDLIAVCVAIRKWNFSQATCLFFLLFVIYVNML